MMAKINDLQAWLDAALARIVTLEAQLDVALTRIVTLEEELNATKALATTDPLTGLLNRRGLDAEGQRMFAHLMRAHRNGTPGDISVVYIDVDDVKRINDHYGHAVGDQALCAVANAVTRNLRQEDLWARVGGDEFVALLAGGKVAVEALTTRISDGLWITLPGSGAPTQIRVSIGCACFNGSVASIFNKGSEETRLRSSRKPSALDISLNRSRQDIESVLRCLLELAEKQMRLAKKRRGTGR